MYLTVGTVLPWLRQKGLLSHAALLEHSWTVVQPDLLRPLLRVARADGRGFFVKQASPVDTHPVAMIDREAALHQLVQDVPWAQPILPFQPRLHLFDPGMHALVMAALPHDTALDHLRRVAVPADTLGRVLGRALATIHRRVPGRGAPGSLLPARLPWILEPDPAARDDMQQPAVRRMLDLVLSERKLLDAITRLREQWRCDTLIHGDAKLDNVIVRTARKPRVWLVDWAFAGIGDPAWDLGTIVHSSLVVWLHGVRLSKSDAVDHAIKAASLPLETVRAFVGGLFAGYEVVSAPPRRSPQSLPLRAFRYAGAALVQTAIAAGRTAPQLTSRQLGLVQMGMRLLDDPDDALRTFHPSHASAPS